MNYLLSRKDSWINKLPEGALKGKTLEEVLKIERKILEIEHSNPSGKFHIALRQAILRGVDLYFSEDPKHQPMKRKGENEHYIIHIFRIINSALNKGIRSLLFYKLILYHDAPEERMKNFGEDANEAFNAVLYKEKGDNKQQVADLVAMTMYERGQKDNWEEVFDDRFFDPKSVTIFGRNVNSLWFWPIPMWLKIEDICDNLDEYMINNPNPDSPIRKYGQLVRLKRHIMRNIDKLEPIEKEQGVRGNSYGSYRIGLWKRETPLLYFDQMQLKQYEVEDGFVKRINDEKDLTKSIPFRNRILEINPSLESRLILP